MFRPQTYRSITFACSSRSATTVLEVIVSITMLMAALTLSLPLILHNERLLIEQRNYRLALDELSNQLDRLTPTSREELSLALEQLTVSPFVAERLPGAALTAELNPIDAGQRLILSLTWQDPNEHKVALAAWLFQDTTFAPSPTR